MFVFIKVNDYFKYVAFHIISKMKKVILQYSTLLCERHWLQPSHLEKFVFSHYNFIAMMVSSSGLALAASVIFYLTDEM